MQKQYHPQVSYSAGLRSPGVPCSECGLKNCSVLKYAEPACLEIISLNKRSRTFSAGQRIVMEGTPARCIFFVESGKIKIFKTDKRGREVILRFARSGDILGFNCCEENYEYQVSAMALTNAVACSLEISVFHELTKKYPGLNYELLRFYKKELIFMEEKALRLATMTVPEKVADALMYMYESYGSDPGSSSISLVMSRQDIANLAGTTKEQVSKVISDLKNRKIIEPQGKYIDILDFDWLSKAANR